MAAKPPKPPGNFLNNNNNNNHSDTKSSIASQKTPVNSSPSTENINNNNSISHHLNNGSQKNTAADGNNGIVLNGTDAASSNKPTSCHCSNISIMHLFHEMKQEFPTIPDQIVAQCVNENCHQRENCILMLRKELALNPIPVQTYPSKVLQRQHQQQRLLQPMKPIRPAPQQPPISSISGQSNSIVNSLNQSVLNTNSNCDSVNSNSLDRNQTKLANSSIVDKKKDVEISNNNSCCVVGERATRNASDMPTSTTPTIVNSVSENNNNNNNCRHVGAHHQTSDACSPQQALQQQQQQHHQQQQPQRVRPTTLDLNLPHQQQQQQQHQQQLRRQLNVQLQQHFQQRQPTKPIRKAPLPPIPPKPVQLTNHHHQHHPHSNNNSGNNTPTVTRNNASLSSPQQGEVITSPISSGESEISVNVSLSSPTTIGSSQHGQLKSPIRHRSVITVQPEPPYTRDFLTSPTSSSSGGSSSQKSFTSVNLTLRQPSTTTPQSTIDISAGPGLSGAGTGLTYSSTSYDARRGFQKNFHITVTDEGGVFSASRIRPRTNYSIEQEQDNGGGGGGDSGGGIGSGIGGLGLKSANQQQYPNTNPLQQQQQQQQKENQKPIVATANKNGEMCLPRVSSGYKEILLRQRERRDKLSTALRDSKKRLSLVEQENNILTNPVSPGESERLDSEIQRLRCDCEAMWNEIENSKRCGPNFETIQGFNSMNNRQQLQQQQQMQMQQVQTPQPFPRQRPPRPPPPVISRHPLLDFVQHHVSSPSSLNSPNQPPPSYQQLQQQQYLQQQLQQQHFLRQQHLQPSTDEEDYSDSNTDGGDEEESEEMWACNMCTFRNHPDLNTCECCENVRILPGTIRIVPSTSASSVASLPGSSIAPATPLMLTHLTPNGLTASDVTATIGSQSLTTTPNTSGISNVASNAGSNSLDGDVNLTQQQLQQFALHT